MSKNRFIAVIFITLSGCAYLADFFEPPHTYSIHEIEGVMNDTIFNVSVEEILPVIEEALIDMGFQLEREQEDLIVTFPLYIEKENFGKYAAEKVNKGYEPVRSDVLYSDPSIELHCVIIPVEEGTRVRVKTIFEAYSKVLFYKETPGKSITEGYHEFEGDLIECKSTGRTERALFDRLSESLK